MWLDVAACIAAREIQGEDLRRPPSGTTSIGWAWVRLWIIDVVTNDVSRIVGLLQSWSGLRGARGRWNGTAMRPLNAPHTPVLHRRSPCLQDNGVCRGRSMAPALSGRRCDIVEWPRDDRGLPCHHRPNGHGLCNVLNLPAVPEALQPPCQSPGRWRVSTRWLAVSVLSRAREWRHLAKNAWVWASRPLLMARGRPELPKCGPPRSTHGSRETRE